MNVNLLIREMAANRHGVVSRDQLVKAGVAAHRIEHRVKTGELRPLHRGVYLVGPIAGVHTRAMAAVLACGGGADMRAAVVSHHTAGAMAGQLPNGGATVELIVQSWRGIKRAGIRVHRLRDLAPDEITIVEGIPVTTPCRTLLDLSTALPNRDLERAVARTLRLELATIADIRSMLTRHRARAGTRRLRSLIDQEAEPAFTRSDAEERLLALIREAGLPGPRVNAVTHGFEVDMLWPEHRLVVEVDGFAYHSSPRAFERDRTRDAVLTTAGLRVMRFTWRQIVRQPIVVIARVALALGQQPASRR
jgi:very-short-patch-repair endonuclease